MTAARLEIVQPVNKAITVRAGADVVVDQYHSDALPLFADDDDVVARQRRIFATRTDFATGVRDRKSTRLNSSHANISYAVFCLIRLPARSTLFPYTTLFRSHDRGTPRDRAAREQGDHGARRRRRRGRPVPLGCAAALRGRRRRRCSAASHLRDAHGFRDRRSRSEEHTSELQSRQYLVCRLLLDPSPSQIYTLSLHDALPIS